MARVPSTIDLAQLVAPGEVIGIDMAEIQLEHPRTNARERGVSNLRFETAWNRLMQHNGADPFIGRRLRSLLNEIGLKRVEALASYECHGTHESGQFAAEGAARYFSATFADQVVELSYSAGWIALRSKALKPPGRSGEKTPMRSGPDHCVRR